MESEAKWYWLRYSVSEGMAAAAAAQQRRAGAAAVAQPASAIRGLAAAYHTAVNCVRVINRALEQRGTTGAGWNVQAAHWQPIQCNACINRDSAGWNVDMRTSTC